LVRRIGDKARALKNTPLFSNLNQKSLMRLARSGTEATAGAGQEVVRQGSRGQAAYVVLDGSLRVKRNNRRIADLGPGDVFGELSLLDGGVRTASVIASTDARVLEIHHRDFASLIEESPAVAKKMMATLASRLRDLDRQFYG